MEKLTLPFLCPPTFSVQTFCVDIRTWCNALMRGSHVHLKCVLVWKVSRFLNQCSTLTPFRETTISVWGGGGLCFKEKDSVCYLYFL